MSRQLPALVVGYEQAKLAFNAALILAKMLQQASECWITFHGNNSARLLAGDVHARTGEFKARFKADNVVVTVLMLKGQVELGLHLGDNGGDLSPGEETVLYADREALRVLGPLRFVRERVPLSRKDELPQWVQLVEVFAAVLGGRTYAQVRKPSRKRVR